MSEFFDFGTTRIGEFEHFRDFIKGFSGSIVEGLPEEFILAYCGDLDEHGVSARDDEGKVRWNMALADKGAEEVTLHVIDGKKGLFRSESESLGEGVSDLEGGS